MPRRVIRPSLRHEVDEELRFHLEMRVLELVAKGWDEEQARAEVLRRAGDLEGTKARMRHEARRREAGMRRRDGWDGTLQDVRFAWRQMRRAPGFGLLAVATLALAIGANAAVFSVVNGVLLKPLPFEEPDRVLMLWSRYLPPSGFDLPKFALSGPEILDLREGTRTLSAVGVYQPGTSRTLTGPEGDARRISATRVSAEVLPLLGVRPALGRVFTPEEDAPGVEGAIILSHALWVERYAGDPGIVGRTVVLNGVATEVVGVMPEGFRLSPSDEAWIPAGLARANEGGRGGHGWFGVARMAPGATTADVDRELERIAAAWADAYEHNVAHFAWAEPALEAAVGDASRTLVLLLVAVGFILVIACANVANLLLARGERRRGEIGVRLALGASRRRVVRQLAVESLLLAAVSAGLGFLLARWLTPLVLRMAPDALPRTESVALDGTALAFTAAAAVATALLFGVLPTMAAARRATARAGSARPGTEGGGTRLRRTLVGAEVALALVVTVLAGLLVRSYAARTEAERGLDTANLLTFSLMLPETDYPEGDQVPERYEEILAGLRAVPGVASASAASVLPFDRGYAQWDFVLDDRPPRAEGDRAWNSGVGLVAPGFFETLGIPVVAGRGLGPEDDAAAPWVGVVSEEFARVYWPGESPLGKRWGYEQGEEEVAWITVVGVAADPVWRDPGEEPYPFAWIPAAQAGLSTYGWPRTMRVAVRTGRAPEAITSAVREVLRSFDPDLPMYRVGTMEDAVSSSLARPRLASALLSLFGGLALVLAAVGLYGVVSYSVASRTREIGIRVALGADRGRVLGMVLREGATPLVVGAAVGLVGAWLATGLVRSLLFGVPPVDPVTFALVPGGLLLVGIAACWIPARRATVVPPTEALREDRV